MPRVLIPSAAPASSALVARGRAALRAIVLLAPVFVTLAAVAQPIAARPGSLAPRVWEFTDAPGGRISVVVMTPTTLRRGERLPLLIALHGWGESVRGVDRGAWGWHRDYELGASDRALRHAPLARDAFLGFVSNARYARLRADLAVRPYGGLVVVAPYTPNVLDDPALASAYGDWVARSLLPRARRELPVLTTQASTGIDGVSLGGLLALEVGFAHPECFGAVGALQAAVRARVPRVLARWRSSADRPAQRVRLVTSRNDHLRPDVRALDAAMRARGIAHEFREVEGPHDYVFNRGAGGVEMLLFHDRALRGLAAE